MRIAIAGGSGFIGQRLTQALCERGDRVTVLSRSPAKVSGLPEGAESAGYDLDLSDFDALINLAGAGIADKRWSDSYKKLIRDSRVDTTARLVDAIAQAEHGPTVLINASAVGFYGARGDEDVDEMSSMGEGYLPEICDEWEQSALKAKDHDCRVVLMRIGIVLSPKGGALARMVPLFKMFVGGKLGSGKQWMSWIHLEDQVALFLHALDNAEVSGALNATAPEPVTNTAFSKRLGQVLGRPCWAPVPGFALKLLVGEFAEFLLTGAKVLPTKAEATGYKFKFPALEGALRDLLD